MAKVTAANPVKFKTVGGNFNVSAESGNATVTVKYEGSDIAVTPKDSNDVGGVLEGEVKGFSGLGACEVTVTTTGEAHIVGAAHV